MFAHPVNYRGSGLRRQQARPATGWQGVYVPTTISTSSANAELDEVADVFHDMRSEVVDRGRHLMATWGSASTSTWVRSPTLSARDGRCAAQNASSMHCAWSARTAKLTPMTTRCRPTRVLAVTGRPRQLGQLVVGYVARPAWPARRQIGQHAQCAMPSGRS